MTKKGVPTIDPLKRIAAALSLADDLNKQEELRQVMLKAIDNSGRTTEEKTAMSELVNMGFMDTMIHDVCTWEDRMENPVPTSAVVA
jgi:SOS response regulatory protein OraA/RecX